MSFSLQPGEFLAILGNNGVGKSTLLKCFNKILKPDSGEFLLDGQNVFLVGSVMCISYRPSSLKPWQIPK